MNIIDKRYGIETVKHLRKFTKLDYKIRKNEADLVFLNICRRDGLTAKFLNFKQLIMTYRVLKQCQFFSPNQNENIHFFQGRKWTLNLLMEKCAMENNIHCRRT